MTYRLKIDVTNNQKREQEQEQTQYPGVAAFYLEHVKDILIREVIGWDTDAKNPCENFKLYFREPEAFAIAGEEQGRKTLHMHILLWVKGRQLLLEKLDSDSKRDRAAAITLLTKDLDCISSIELAPYCEYKRKICMPKVVTEQNLRILRHMKGYDVMNEQVLHCHLCPGTWTNEEMIDSPIKSDY